MNIIKSNYSSKDYIKSVKIVAKEKGLIGLELSDFYVDVSGVIQTAEQYLGELLDKSDEEIYQEYRKIFKEKMKRQKEKNKYCSYKYQGMTNYSEKAIKNFYEFYKIGGFDKIDITLNPLSKRNFIRIYKG